MKVIREEKYIYAEVGENSYKEWRGILYENGDVETQWGRVGETLQSKLFPGLGETFLEKKMREKTRKGYTKPPTIEGTATVQLKSDAKLEDIATSQIASNSSIVVSLVKELVAANVHDILSATTMKYDTSKGTFSTPMGIVTETGIRDARDLLLKLADAIEHKDFDSTETKNLFNLYLRLIPQSLGRRKLSVQSVFADAASIAKQSDVLDSLDASLQMVLLSGKDADAPVEVTPQLFAAKLVHVEDGKIIDRIRRYYNVSMNKSHQCAHLGVKNVYEVEIDAMAKAFEKDGRKIGNVQELWHGTRKSNLLSIIKSGFMIPKTGAAHVTGRLFGDGLYFSDQSTKSLNYAYGYWNRADGRGREERCFMFMCDVSMGRVEVPRYGQRLLSTGYDSFHAKPGQSGIMNNEMIVFRVAQVNPKYLIEFTPGGK